MSTKFAIRAWQGNYDESIITFVAANPKKEGSNARQRFALYRPRMTPSQYVLACKDAPRGEAAKF